MKKIRLSEKDFYNMICEAVTEIIENMDMTTPNAMFVPNRATQEANHLSKDERIDGESEDVA